MADELLESESAKYTKVSIWRRGASYSLRARLPDKTTGHIRQQWIPTGCKATKAGLKVAQAKAAKLESDLLLERFSWDDWGQAKPLPKAETTGHLVERFLDWKSDTVNPENLKSDYRAYTRFLPADKPLTPAMLINTCRAITPANSRARKYCVMAFRQLGEYAGLTVDWKGLSGNYKPEAFDPNKLPSDEEIEANWDAIRPPMTKWIYGMLATYGIRPHEIYYLDYSRIGDDDVLHVLRGKTGKRVTYPCRAEWVERFKLYNARPPACGTDALNRRLGERVSYAFRRSSVPHIPYALRHAYAIRLARVGVPVAIAAKWMGHSVQVHTNTYHGAMSEREYQEVWERIVKPPRPTAREGFD